jgi:hypothetical protein
LLPSSPPLDEEGFLEVISLEVSVAMAAEKSLGAAAAPLRLDMNDTPRGKNTVLAMFEGQIRLSSTLFHSEQARIEKIRSVVYGAQG